MKKILNNKKILVFSIILILLSTTYTSSLVSKPTDDVIVKQASNPMYDLLQNLVDRFPALAESKVIQFLLDFFSDETEEEDENDPPFTCHPDLEVTKQVRYKDSGEYDTSISAEVGEWVTFKIIVENTGQYPLSITVLDTLPEGLLYTNNAYVNGILCPPTEVDGQYQWFLYCIAPEEIVTITFTAEVTQCGQLDNYVTATADFEGTTVSDDSTATVNVACEENPDIKLEKSVTPDSVCTGQTVEYSYKITNTGDVELINIALTDDKLGDITLPTTNLGPMEEIIATQSAIITEDTTNIATVTAETCGGQCISNQSSAFVDLLTPSINIVKQADITEAEVGETITYTYTITNDGEVSLTGVSLEDDILGPVSLDDTELEPTESVVAQITYIVKETDLPGPIVNVATVTAIPPCGCGDSVCDQDTETVDLISCNPSMRLGKIADIYTAEIGDTITYTYIVTNDGDSTITNIQVVDDLLGPVSMDDTSLGPYQSTTGTKTYVVKLSDLPGPITNNAIATSIAECNDEQLNAKASLSINIIKPCAYEIWVDDNWFDQSNVNQYNNELILGYNAFRTIQEAVEAVCDCGTIHVLAGSYYGQILINKSLELLGEDGAEIHGSSLNSYTIDSSAETYAPVILAFSGMLDGNNIISDGNLISVKVDGFKIYAYNTIAILYHNVGEGCVESIISNNVIIAHIGVLISGTDVFEEFGVKINYNYFGLEPCELEIGVKNIADEIVDARYNWWRKANGPSSESSSNLNFDAISNRPADGFGDRVIGLVQFDPWYGVDSWVNAEYAGYTPDVGYCVSYDGSQSFAYDKNGYIDFSVEWKFFDGTYKFRGLTGYHCYDEPGTQTIQLKCTVLTYNLEYITGKWVDTDKDTVNT